MRILTLGNGDFQIYSYVRGTYNVYVKKLDGHYSVMTGVPESELDAIVHAWTTCKYVYKWI